MTKSSNSPGVNHRTFSHGQDRFGRKVGEKYDGTLEDTATDEHRQLQQVVDGHEHGRGDHDNKQ